MLRTLPIIAFLLTPSILARADYRKMPCKTPEIESSCFHTHARLTLGNGTPSVRLWPVGTNHLYGIYSNSFGFAHQSEIVPSDTEAPELPPTVTKHLPKSDSGGWTVYGDFEVCPLEPPIQGHMQAACIESATHIFAPKQ